MDNVIVKVTARKMTRGEAIKEFFGTNSRAVESREIIEFARADKEGLAEVGDACLAALGATRKTS
jgi:hypothetical protein